MRRERKSAKDVIHNFANELLMRGSDKDASIKLLTIETIALRMGWNDLYNRLRFRKNQPAPQIQAQDAIETDDGLKWWQK